MPAAAWLAARSSSQENNIRRSLLFLLLPTFVLATPTVVTVNGRQLRVNGQPFTVKGVNYSPIPVASTGGAPESGCANDSNWWNDHPSYIADFPLIHQMGANTIRTYAVLNDASAANVTQVRAMLDKASANGLYVIMGYYPSHFGSVTDPATQTNFLAAVNAYKDHPAVLMWSLGNEQNLDNGQDPAWYPYLNTILGLAKQADPNHPFTTVEGECPQCGPAINFTIGAGVKADASMTNLDLWGVTAYRGKSFNGLFTQLASTTTKPILLAEYGKDAYNDSAQAEDAAMQARYLSAQLNEIQAELSAVNATKPLVGSAWFEWTDEWWKASASGDTCSTHDTHIQFTRAGDGDDPNYNEEWFGLASIKPINAITNPSGTARTLRSAYTVLQTSLNPGGATTSGATGDVFNGTVRNYPNPFRVGAEATKFVANTGIAAKISIKIYDAGGQYVASLATASTGPERVELNWDGRNHQGAYVSSGLYIAKIEGEGAGKESTQFRRVVAVK